MLTLGKGSIFSLLHFWVIRNCKEETVIKINPKESPRLHTVSLLHPWPLKPAISFTVEEKAFSCPLSAHTANPPAHCTMCFPAFGSI